MKYFDSKQATVKVAEDATPEPVEAITPSLVHDGRQLGIKENPQNPGGAADQVAKFIDSEYSSRIKEQGRVPSRDALDLTGLLDGRSKLGRATSFSAYAKIPLEFTEPGLSGIADSNVAQGVPLTVDSFVTNPRMITHIDQNTGREVAAGHFIHPETGRESIVFPHTMMGFVHNSIIKPIMRHVCTGNMNHEQLGRALAVASKMAEPREKYDGDGNFAGWESFNPNSPKEHIRHPIPVHFGLETILHNLTNSPGIRVARSKTGDAEYDAKVDAFHDSLWEQAKTAKFGLEASPIGFIMGCHDQHHLFHDQQHKLRALTSGDSDLAEITKRAWLPDKSVDGTIDFTKFAPRARLASGHLGWNSGVNQGVMRSLISANQRRLNGDLDYGDIQLMHQGAASPDLIRMINATLYTPGIDHAQLDSEIDDRYKAGWLK